MTNFTFSRFSLKGKSVLITGSAGLLGVEHARAVLEAGGHPVLTDLNITALERLKRKLESEYEGSLVSIMEMDVTNEQSIVKVKNSLDENEFRISVLINNAAINPTFDSIRGRESRLENYETQRWDLELNVGLRGAFSTSKIFGTEMVRMGNGVILNIASDLSEIAPNQGLYRREGLPEEDQSVKPVTYSVIKTGLIGLTRYLSTYWAKNGVRVNALSPGGVFTNQESDFLVRVSELIPLGRMAHSDEYRSAIQFLCSDASSYMTGQNIVMDGGRSVW